ncbi:hypothetical protein [Nocardia puris]|nr:hypothetical protein [Nocardia puris]
MVTVRVGSDRLPTEIRFSNGWKDAFYPAQYEQSILDAYHYAVYELAVQYAESGTVPKPTVPSLHDAAPLLLRTRTLDEYRELYDQLFLDKPYTVHGPGYNLHGEPTLTVTASLSRLISLRVDPEWVRAMNSEFVAQDIVECCDQVRARKYESVNDVYLNQESNRELASRLVRHERYLTEHSLG